MATRHVSAHSALELQVLAHNVTGEATKRAVVTTWVFEVTSGLIEKQSNYAFILMKQIKLKHFSQ